MSKTTAIPLDRIETVLDRFTQWLQGYGETSWDHQSYFTGPIGRRAKALYYWNRPLGTLAVSPMILSEAFIPSARRLFAWKLRFPIADAHYAMGFAFLSKARGDATMRKRAVHFLEELQKSRCPGYEHYCWGYPFDWETRGGTMVQDTPLITTTPYVYEAFRDVYRLDGDSRWKDVMTSMVRHATEDIKDFPTSGTASTCSYGPFDTGGVINASAYRAGMLASASLDLEDEHLWTIGKRNLNFVLENQRPDGSWYYSVDGGRDFVDHFHTCFVLKALAKVDKLRPSDDCRRAIDKGVEYYAANLLNEKGMPKPFSKAPRMTVYRSELYDYAECINLCTLLHDRLPQMDRILKDVVGDLLDRWVKPNGSFRSRELWLGWDNVPMHRWAQSQIFRSLSQLYLQEREAKTSRPEASLKATSNV